MKKIFEILLIISTLSIIVYKWFPFDSKSVKSDFKQELDDTSLPISSKSDVLPKQSIKSKIAATPTSQFPPKDEATVQKIQLKFNTGDYFGALKIADEFSLESRSQMFREWLESQMRTLLTTAGWAHLKLGNCEETIILLRRADALGRTAEISKGLAFCYRKSRNLYAAEEQIIWFMKEKPQDNSMQFIYLDVLESLGEYASAAKYLSEINESATGEEKKNLSKRLEEMQSKENESSHQQTLKSRFFVLRFRVYEHGGLAEYVLETLDRGLDEFIEDYGFREPSTQIEVLLYPDNNFKKIVADSPDWAEGLFDGRMRIPIRDKWKDQESPEGLKRVLRHELVHALFAHMTDYRALPPWFDEGVAQKASCSTASCRKFSFAPKPGNFLERSDFLSSYTSYAAVKAGLAYHQSLYLIHTLESLSDDGDGLRSVISNITVRSKIDSDSLLRGRGTSEYLNFEGLISATKTKWADRYRFE